MKRGANTTEFFLVLAVDFLATVALLTGKITADVWIGVLGVTGTGYSVSRGLAKGGRR